jgi:LysM repeat protein
MGGKIIAGVIGFVILVLIIQNYVLGGDDGPDALSRSGAAPTATLPAQTPEAISLGQVQTTGASGAGATGSGGTTGGGTYVVQSGDTLGSIATALNVSPEAQAEWIAAVLEANGIPDARLLQAGQELVIPEAPAGPGPGGGQNNPAAGGGQTPAAGSGIEIATATPSPGSGEGGSGVYIVESGDTPLGIAEKFCVEGAAAWVNELVELNGIDPNVLSVGQELALPAGTPDQCG